MISPPKRQGIDPHGQLLEPLTTARTIGWVIGGHQTTNWGQELILFARHKIKRLAENDLGEKLSG